jgi:hypothetical protein
MVVLTWKACDYKTDSNLLICPYLRENWHYFLCLGIFRLNRAYSALSLAYPS